MPASLQRRLIRRCLRPRAADRPLHALLGGRRQETLPLYHSITCIAPDEMARRVLDLVSRHRGVEHVETTCAGAAPDALAELVLALMAKSPDDRPASARDVRTRLEAMIRPR